MKTLLVTTEFNITDDAEDQIQLASSLPQELSKKNIDVRVIIPVNAKELALLEETKNIGSVRVPGSQARLEIHQLLSKQTSSIIYLVRVPEIDNASSNRKITNDMMVFSRAVTAVALGRTSQEWIPDLVHCIGWKTALIPSLLSKEWNRPASIFTIDHMNKQGRLGSLPLKQSHEPDLSALFDEEILDELYFYKTGTVFSDMTTISVEIYGWLHYSEEDKPLCDLLNNSVDRLELISFQSARSQRHETSTVDQYTRCYQTALDNPVHLGGLSACSA